MLDTTIHSVQTEYDGVLCIRREDREMRGNFVHCHCSLWPGRCGWQLKTKQRNCRNCCLSVWVLLLHLRSQRSPALRHCGGNVWSISAGCHTLCPLCRPRHVITIITAMIHQVTLSSPRMQQKLSLGKERIPLQCTAPFASHSCMVAK